MKASRQPVSAAQVSSSCLVALQDDDSGKVIAGLDSRWKPGEVVPATKLAMAHAAIEARAVVTWKASDHRENTDFLAAIDRVALPDEQALVVSVRGQPGLIVLDDDELAVIG